MTWETENTADEDGLYVSAEGGVRELHYKTRILLHTMQETGIKEINRGNAAEMLYRTGEIEALHGPLMGNDEGPLYFTAWDITRHIGLRANAVPMSNTAFDTALRKRQKAEIQPRRNKARHAFEILAELGEDA